MKTIIVTDPCYIIKDSEWDDACRYCFRDKWGKNIIEETAKFSGFITSLLRVISGDEKAIADGTGFGDWTNEIDGQEFYADSGMVSICEYSSKLKKYLEKNNIMLPMGAFLKVSEDATYEIDTSNPNWSVVKITDNGRTITSLPPEA